MNYMYLPERGYNYNAIDFYLKVIEEASALKGEPMTRISDLSIAKPGDTIVATTTNDFVKAYFKTNGCKIYVWIQGVEPEEMVFKAHGIFKKIKLWCIWNSLDMFTVHKATGIFFVSEAMRQHYCRKFGYRGNNYMIMPCFNQDLEEDAFAQFKYETPSFVYTGSLAKWQCFERTVETFKAIREAIPSAKFSVFTGQVEEAKVVIAKYGLEGITVRNVPYQELPAEMNKFKYGFLLRDDIAINNVATPTKMSSYIGCGIIPVFSPVIGDFNKVFGSLKHVVNAESLDGMIAKIKQLESDQVEASEVLKEYRTIFDEYYCRPMYVEKISKFI